MAKNTRPQLDLPSSKHPLTKLLKCSWTLESNFWGSREVLISEISPLHGEMVFCVAAKMLTKNLYHSEYYWFCFVLFFGGVNLHKLGLKIKAIEVSAEGTRCLDSSGCITYMIPENRIQNSNTLQVFSRNYLKLHDDSSKVTFFFRVLVQGNAASFAYCLLDATLKLQLWGACSEGSPWCDIDIGSKLDAKKFQAHKAVLAARSSVFAEMFKPTGDKTVNLIQLDADSASVQNFLKFLYTGALDDSSYADECLLQLAKTYGVTSLRETCEAAIKSLGNEEFCMSVMKMFTNDEATVASKDKLVLGSRSKVTSDDYSAYYSCEWVVNEELKNGETRTSDMFSYRDVPLLYVMVHAKNGSYYLVFKSHAAGIKAFRVVKAYYTWHKAQLACGTWQSLGWGKLESNVMDSTTSPVLFLGKLANQPAGPIHLHFLFELCTNEIKNFSHGMMDVNWFKDMSSCLSGTFSDVEISCHSEKLFAHRAVLSARSPVFAAEFSSTEPPTGKSLIVMDEEPSTVLHFLRFLYTGLVPHSVCIEKRADLEKLAVKYQVKSLQSWLSNYTVKTETNPLVALFSSLSLY